MTKGTGKQKGKKRKEEKREEMEEWRGRRGRDDDGELQNGRNRNRK